MAQAAARCSVRFNATPLVCFHAIVSALFNRSPATWPAIPCDCSRINWLWSSRDSRCSSPRTLLSTRTGWRKRIASARTPGLSSDCSACSTESRTLTSCFTNGPSASSARSRTPGLLSYNSADFRASRTRRSSGFCVSKFTESMRTPELVLFRAASSSIAEFADPAAILPAFAAPEFRK